MLQPIVGLCDLARLDIPPGSEADANLVSVIQAARRIEEITSQVMVFGRSMEGTPHAVSLTSVLREACDVLKLLPPDGIELELVVDTQTAIAAADETELVQLLINLVHNAIDAIGKDGGAIEIRLETRMNRSEASAPPSGIAVLTVRDTGCGMDAETLERMFDPFFTTKPVGEGTGMGLSVAHGLVEGWGGRLYAQSTPGGGTRMIIELPLLPDEAE